MATTIATGPPGSKGTLLQKCEDHLLQRYDFRFDSVKGRIEYRNKGESAYRPLQEYDINSIWRVLLKHKIRAPVSTLLNLLHSSFTPVHDPFRDYLASLPAWDQTTDHIQQLAATVTTTTETLWTLWFRKWIVAMVGTMQGHGVVNHTVIVLAGGQGTGKTTWIECLVPELLRNYAFLGTVDPGNKDTLVHLAECMLINLDELENLSKSEIGALKSLITQGTINIRRPYARGSERLVRRASFAGSINSRQFLNDATGSRRFLCVDVLAIENNHSISIEHVYSQALYMFRDGYRYWFNHDEIGEVNESNHKYQNSTYEEEMLLKTFAPAVKEEAGSLFLTTSEIAAYLKASHGVSTDPGSIQRLGKALAKHHFVRGKKGGQLYKYWLNSADGAVCSPPFLP